jgi:hypothetical protein
MSRYGRNHIRLSKDVMATRKEHRCHICGGTIAKGSTAIARNGCYLSLNKDYEHAEIFDWGTGVKTLLQKCPPRPARV